MVWTDDPKSDEVIERAGARDRSAEVGSAGETHKARRAESDGARPETRHSAGGRTYRLALPLIGAYQAYNV